MGYPIGLAQYHHSSGPSSVLQDPHTIRAPTLLVERTKDVCLGAAEAVGTLPILLLVSLPSPIICYPLLCLVTGQWGPIEQVHMPRITGWNMWLDSRRGPGSADQFHPGVRLAGLP